MIKGIKESDDPVVYNSIKKALNFYDIKEIMVVINNDITSPKASSFLKDKLILSSNLDVFSQDELEAIMAHELSHVYNRDTNTHMITLLITSSPLIIYSVILSIFAIINYSDSAQIYNNALYDIKFWITITLFIIGLKAVLWASRKFEYRCDMDAVVNTKNPDALKTALLKFDNIQDKTRPGVRKIIAKSEVILLFSNFGQSHPLIEDRIKQIDYLKKINKF